MRWSHFALINLLFLLPLSRCGHDVPFVKKGRFGVVHGSVQEHFNPYHVAIETGDKDDLTQEKIEDKV